MNKSSLSSKEDCRLSLKPCSVGGEALHQAGVQLAQPGQHRQAKLGVPGSDKDCSETGREEPDNLMLFV